MIVDSTNPRVMADNIRELAANSGGSELPEVTAADNGKILGVVEGSWNKMDAPSGAIDYSTTEQDTGLKWINGKEIYQKTFENIGAYTYQSLLDTGIPISEDIVDYYISGVASYSGIDYAITGSNLVLSITSGTSNPAVFVQKGDTNYMAYYNGPTMTGYVTIRYTKTPATETRKRKTTKGEN